VSSLATPPRAAGAQITVALYGGLATTAADRITLEQPGRTDLEFRGVSWRAESLESPIYYGVRIAYWLRRGASAGLAFDFTHTKMFAELDDTVQTTGTRAGTPVTGAQPLRATFDRLSFSHGHNLLTVNALLRWPLGPDSATGSRPRIHLYGGVGLGLAIPHVEVSLAGSSTDEYQVTGPALQALAGVSVPVLGRLALLAEYKLDHARLEGRLAGGGTVEAKPWTHQLAIGLSFHAGGLTR
jgi:lipid A oxidase